MKKELCKYCTLLDDVNGGCRWPRVARLCDQTNDPTECPIDPKRNVERYRDITNAKKKHAESDGY